MGENTGAGVGHTPHRGMKGAHSAGGAQRRVDPYPQWMRQRSWRSRRNIHRTTDPRDQQPNAGGHNLMPSHRHHDA